jgi:ATP-binding cassette subfamily F protein 3
VFERRKMALEIRPSERGGQRVFRLRTLSKSFDGDPVLEGVSFDVYRRERLGVVGPNGAGKSVLGQIVAGELAPTSGELWVGPSVRIGYLAQGFLGQDPTLSPVETVRKAKAMYEGEAVALLAKFLFRYDQMRTPVDSLSGGERTRLELCRLMLSGANCLVLDEPTNHLDIESMEVLEGAVESFDGTAILISHDRYLLDRLCDRILEVRDGEVRIFDGGYDDWITAKAAAV